jgi:DNA primase
LRPERGESTQLYGHLGTRNELKIDGRKVPVSNRERPLYPAAHFTKAQVIDYYVRISPFLLPHLKDRPITLKRYPDGVRGEFFYEKDAPGYTPKWVKTFPSLAVRVGGTFATSCIVSETAKAERIGKVFIDWSQNADFKTPAGVYSLPPKGSKPFVSLAITWEELSRVIRTPLQ